MVAPAELPPMTPPPLQHGMELIVRPGAGVRVDDVPLATSVEPDGRRLRQVGDEAIGVGDRRIVRVQHGHVLDASFPPRAQYPLLVEDAEVALLIAVPAGRRHDDETTVLETTTEFDEALHDSGAGHRPTSCDHQGAVTRAVLGV